MTQTAEHATSKEDQDARQTERDAREAAALATRQEWLAQWQQEGVSRHVKPNIANTFAPLWNGVDMNALEFAAGMSNISKVKLVKPRFDPNDPEAVKRAQAQAFVITSKFGGTFSYIKAPAGDFIGLSVAQAKKKPLNDATAEDIARTALARGWTHVNVSGSQEDRDKLWLAAQKYGLIVDNHEPSAQARQAYEASKAKQSHVGTDVQTGFTGNTGLLEHDIIDAEFTDVTPALPKPETKFLTHDKGGDDTAPSDPAAPAPKGP